MTISTFSPLAISSFIFSMEVLQRDGTKPAQRISLAGVQWLNVQKFLLCHDYSTVTTERHCLWQGRKMGTGKNKNIYGEKKKRKAKRHLGFPESPFPWEGAVRIRTGICSKELIFSNCPRMPFSWCTAWFKGFPEKQHTINQRATLIGSSVILKTAIPFCGLITGN